MQKVLFYPNKGQLHEDWKPGVYACSDRNSTTLLLAEHLNPNDDDEYESGYRFLETKVDDDTTTFDHGGATTHTRLSAWVVTRTEEYLANIEGMQKYSKIVICYCNYSPLSDGENPWRETKGKGIVSPDSFGGDRERFREYVDSLSPEQKETVEIYDPQPV